MHSLFQNLPKITSLLHQYLSKIQFDLFTRNSSNVVSHLLKIAIAIEPTPPVAPVTKISPLSGLILFSINSFTLKAAVKPAVPKSHNLLSDSRIRNSSYPRSRNFTNCACPPSEFIPISYPVTRTFPTLKNGWSWFINCSSYIYSLLHVGIFW